MRRSAAHNLKAWRATTWSLLALVLVVAQMLGQWHAVAHTGGDNSPFATAQHSHSHPHQIAAHAHGNSPTLHHDRVQHGAESDWLGALFADHHQLDCRVLDHLASGGAPGFAPAPWLAELPRALPVALRHAPAVPAEAHVAFQARAPPLRA